MRDLWYRDYRRKKHMLQIMSTKAGIQEQTSSKEE